MIAFKSKWSRGLMLALSFCASLSTALVSARAQVKDRVLLVVAKDMDSARALGWGFRLVQPGDWTLEMGPEPIAIGRAGLGWGAGNRHLAMPGEPIKREGDGRSPAGFYTIGAPFGFFESDLKRYVKLDHAMHYCVDDLGSPDYNRIIPKIRAGHFSGEAMRSVELYRTGLFVNYPTDRTNKGGSCIFIHVWKTARDGTSGCFALPEDRVVAIQMWSQSGADLIVGPRQALGRLATHDNRLSKLFEKIK